MGEPKPYISNPFSDIHDTLWVLESLDEDGQGTAFSLKDVGIVTCAHVLRKSMVAFKASNPSARYNVYVKAKNDDLDVAIVAIEGEVRCGELTPADPSLIKTGDRLILAGYPNHWKSDTGCIVEVSAVGFRTKSLQRWIVINGPIVTGSSGGPVLNAFGEVIGIAATGSDSFENAYKTEHHGVIPITSLISLQEEGERNRTIADGGAWSSIDI
jgi:S1-C subfamily serine protease